MSFWGGLIPPAQPASPEEQAFWGGPIPPSPIGLDNPSTNKLDMWLRDAQQGFPQSMNPSGKELTPYESALLARVWAQMQAGDAGSPTPVQPVAGSGGGSRGYGGVQLPIPPPMPPGMPPPGFGSPGGPGGPPGMTGSTNNPLLSPGGRDTEGRNTPAPATFGMTQEVPYEGAEGAQPDNLVPTPNPLLSPGGRDTEGRNTPAAGTPVGGAPYDPNFGVGAAGNASSLRGLGWNEGDYTIGQNRFGASNPHAAMRMLLTQKGINPNFGLGKMFMDDASAVRAAYDFFAGAAGQAAQSTQHLLAFMKGWADMQTAPAKEGYADQAQIRGVNRAQVEIGLKDPNSDIGRAMRMIMDGDAQAGVQGQGADGLWDGVLQPLARAAGANSLYLMSKKAEFYKHFQDWEQRQLSPQGGGMEGFVDYLGRLGFKV
jgi:hypothetical protein